MGVNWTREQLQVIELRNCNILVSAAAGSGKTAVLVERILSMLTDMQNPVDIDRLLIVTFTNAAAGEMRERIRVAIEQKIEELEETAEAGDALLEHLQRQTALLNVAQIATIHSFCQYVIRNHFHTIDLDPSMRIADEGEQKLLQNDVLQELLEEKYAAGDETFLETAEALAPGRDDSGLTEIILSLYRYSQSFPWPETWLSQCRMAYDIQAPEQLEQADWLRHAAAFVRSMLLDVEEQIEEALTLTLSEDGPRFYESALQSDRETVDALLEAEDYRQQSRAFADRPAWARLSGKKDPEASEEKKALVKTLREEYKKTIAELEDSFFAIPVERVAEQMRDCLPLITQLTELTGSFAGRYAQAKQKKNLMDFNDLEHFALKILVREEDKETLPTAVARDLAAHYEEIMIDEYQDSNLVQELILTAVSKIRDGRHNIFMVGDVKQSIYRFRLARPELFMEKYGSYSRQEGDCRRIDLHKNFRSRKEVLAGVNFLFEQIMERRIGNVEYDEAAALYAGADFPPGNDAAFCRTEVLMIDTSGQPEELQENALYETSRESEARAVAGRIRQMVGSESIYDKETGGYRKVRYGDIVILLRTISGWAEVFDRMLTDMDIPAHTGSRTGYFKTVEVQTVLSLLKLIDNPRQDIPMAAVLRSPMVGLSGRELADIRSADPQAPFYEACMAYEPLHGFFEMLQEFRKMANDTPIHELILYVLERTGYGNYAAAMPGGSQRKANLDMLVEKAIAYEKGSYRGIYNFNRYIDNLYKYDIDYGEAVVGGQEDVVRIMSIHKSKGLEFPIVFVSGMGKPFNQSDARSAVLCHAGLGIGCDRIDVRMRTRKETLLKSVMKKETTLENLGEEMRVLYVALTRAKEKLILTGSVADVETKLRKWNVCRRKETVLSFTQRAHAGCYWDWVIPALMRNKCFAGICREYEIAQDMRNPLYDREIYMEAAVVTRAQLLAGETRRQEEYLMTEAGFYALAAEGERDTEAADRLEKSFAFCYPYRQDACIPGKVSVSELKKMSLTEPEEATAALYEEQTPVPLIPEFLQKEHRIVGAARGTIYHRYMECVDFALFLHTRDEQERQALFEAEKKRMTEAGYLTPEEARQIEGQKIEAFFDSPLAGRMARAAARGELFRERQFVMDVPANTIRPEWNGSQTVLIQGIIDAYFIEEGQITLVDYKTDFVKLQEASSLCQKYGVQLQYYKTALERLTHMPVKEKLIYSFCLDRVLVTGDSK